MRKYITLFFSVSLFLCACSETPDGIIKPAEMTGILADVHIVDGTLSYLSPAPDTVYKYGMGRYLTIFKKYHTDSAQFRKSYKYYTTKPGQLTDIYDNVMKILQAKSDSLTRLMAQQNTAASRKPALPTTPPGKIVNPPPAAHPFMVPGHTGLTPAQVKKARESFEKNQARRRALLKQK